ncbi:TPA: hypothetical protein ACWXHD_005403 [Klebsiella pneumoniae]|uniref:IS903D transposase n=1 Tax=Klebsiella pneumoniae TaxID=573 RepID=A0A4P0XKA1_KLEPN|nr:hypothetical protein [Klebsiella pneumoniae]MBD7510093.1 hypothetical protein [Klebsiella pneumoniae]MBR7381502.1 hypothetical protein [Klebsiella pneumoniae]MBR7392921.1 hypothetical protein [Klebsiella pneumoniae]MCF1902766.1 hypothetical protein [Klebsiella pneumoniae]
MSYGWLFESPDDDISGDNHINLEHLPPELKQVAIQIGVASENESMVTPVFATPILTTSWLA